MNFKECNTCGRSWPDTNEYYERRVKKGGIWGTVARCKKCDAQRRKETREAKRLQKLFAEQGVIAPLR